MSPVCGIIRSSFDDYRQDALPAPQRRMLRDHLESCEGCRDAANAYDPTFHFARRVRDEIPDVDRQRILSAVRTGVELMETERRIARSRRRRIGPAAAAAVVALILLTPDWRAPRSAVPPESNAASDRAPSAVQVPAQSAPPAALQSAGLTEAAPTSDATIYDWNPGAGREEPRVVWIVDRGLDI
jgi:hypothetical protein